MIFNFYKQANAFNSTKAMCVLLLLLAALLHATSTVNALECLTGLSIKMKVPSVKKLNDASADVWALIECPAIIKHCINIACKLDAEALSEGAPGKSFPPDTHVTTTNKGCMLTAGGECEMPNEFNGQDLRKIKKHCGISCSTANARNGTLGTGKARNGTLGLRSFGTVAAMMAFIAAFFLRWN